MTGILNQAGGEVLTTGVSAEGNGIRLGHYPQTRSVYNMMGGTLTVGADYDLGCATDGQGWFNMTGGRVFATRVMLNERDSTSGYGRLTVAGGELNVGSLSGNVQAISNAITADLYAPYRWSTAVRGVVRAVTNLYLPLNATLYGTGTNAVTFDASSFVMYQSGNLSGTGGLNKAGSGTLVLSGTNTYAGGTRILAGTVRLTPPCLGPTGTVAFAISNDGTGGVIDAAGIFLWRI
jgi:autotransporter-associated beta strand protein